MKCIQALHVCLMYGCSFLSMAQTTNVLLSGRDDTQNVSRFTVKGDQIKMQQDGTFEHRLFLDTPSFVNLETNGQNFELFLHPGDRLHIVFDGEGVQFQGEGAAINTFLIHHRKQAKDNSNYLDTYNAAVFTKTPAAFKTTIDSLENMETALFQEFFGNGASVNEHFVHRIKTDIVFRNRRYHLLYPQNYHRHHNYKEVVGLPPTYFEALMEGSFDDPLFIRSSNYTRCVNFYLDLLATGAYKMRHPYHAPVKRISSRYEAIINLNAEEAIQDALIKEHFNQHVWTYRVEAFANSYKMARVDVKDTTTLKEIEGLMDIGHNRRSDADTLMLYSITPEAKLYAHVFTPSNESATKSRPAHLFFHGGGWAMGMPEWSYSACKGAAEEGRVGIAFDYRLRNSHGATIRDAVVDALMAVAWVRENAEQLGIDPNKILVEGFSAGGHLALATAMIDKTNFGMPDQYSSRPDAIILGSTPYDVTHIGRCMT
ncbi:MAG: alpha/beta hydrolase [Bacteroidota bacterium]